MRIMTIAISISIYSCLVMAKAAQINNCQSFVGNDKALSNYLVLKSDCTLDRRSLENIAKKNSGFSFKLSELNDVNGVDNLVITEGLGKKEITLRKKDGQLAQIEVSRTQSSIDLDKNQTEAAQPMTTKEIYTFECLAGNCSPKLGIERHENNGFGGVSTLDSQLFDTNLCKKLKTFFSANPKAASCLGDFEKKSADLLKDYRRDRMNYMIPLGMGMMSPMTFGGSQFMQPLSAISGDKNSEQSEQNNLQSAKRTKPINDSKLALALSLYNDCLNDKRISSVMNEPPVQSENSQNKNQNKKTKGIN